MNDVCERCGEDVLVMGEPPRELICSDCEKEEE